MPKTDRNSDTYMYSNWQINTGNNQYIVLFEDLRPGQQIFQSFWDGFLGLSSTFSNGDEVSCSRTQHCAQMTVIEPATLRSRV